jgi:hypothetical protein
MIILSHRAGYHGRVNADDAIEKLKTHRRNEISPSPKKRRNYKTLSALWCSPWRDGG